MKFLNLLSILLLTGTTSLAANTYIYKDETAPYSQSLSCYQCIQSDFIYCMQSAEHKIMEIGAAPVNGFCC